MHAECVDGFGVGAGFGPPPKAQALPLLKPQQRAQLRHRHASDTRHLRIAQQLGRRARPQPWPRGPQVAPRRQHVHAAPLWDGEAIGG
eukprot:361095-Chlamydomonas_euryale.AAC.3